MRENYAIRIFHTFPHFLWMVSLINIIWQINVFENMPRLPDHVQPEILRIATALLTVFFVVSSAILAGVGPDLESTYVSPSSEVTDNALVPEEPVQNATEDRGDPTACHGGAQVYTECEVDRKSQYVVHIVSRAEPTDPRETANRSLEDVIVLVYSVEHDARYLEKIIRFRISEFTPHIAEYVAQRAIDTVVANRQTANETGKYIDITTRTVAATVSHELDRINETQGTEKYYANYSITKVNAVVVATQKTIPRVVDMADATIRRSPRRVERAASETPPAALDSANRTGEEAPRIIDIVPIWVNNRREHAQRTASEAQSDVRKTEKTLNDPTDEGPRCDTGGIVQYSRCETEYKAFVALYLLQNTDASRPIDMTDLYLETTQSNIADIRNTDIHYYDDEIHDPLVSNMTDIIKNGTWQVRQRSLDSNPNCGGEEAEYTRCETEYKSHTLLTEGLNASYPTDITRTLDELGPVVTALVVDSYANDVPYYASHGKNRSAPVRDIPEENGSCNGPVVRYTTCEADYKADFVLEDTVNRTYPGDATRTVAVNLWPAVAFATDIVANDYPFYDDFTYHPGVVGASDVAKNATYPSRKTVTADDQNCGGESIEYTRCRTEFKASVVLERVIRNAYPTDITKTQEEVTPILLVLAEETLEDANYYTRADLAESVDRSFNTVDDVVNSKPVGAQVRGRTRELKWRTSPVREVPSDDPDCSGQPGRYTACETNYKSHVVLNDIFENTYPADTDETFWGVAPILLYLTADTIENDVPYYRETVNNRTSGVSSPADSTSRQSSGSTQTPSSLGGSSRDLPLNPTTKSAPSGNTTEQDSDGTILL